MNTKNGFSTLLAVLITAVIVGALSGVITYASVVSKKDLEIEDLKEQLSQAKEETQTQVEAGSMNLETSGTQTKEETTETPSTTTTNEIANWKTYTNDKYGFSFKYPGEWEVRENELSKKNGDEILLIMDQKNSSNISVRFSTKNANYKDVTSNTISVWLKDKFTDPVTARNTQKVKINNVDYTEVEMQDDPTTNYFAMITETKEGIFAIEFGIIVTKKTEKTELPKISNQILSTFQFTK